MDSLAESVGKRIKEIRKLKGLRQEDMEPLGLSYKYFQKIEQGKANITLSTLEKVAEALGVSPGEFFYLPFSDNPEAGEAAAVVADLIASNEAKKIHKLNLFLKEFI